VKVLHSVITFLVAIVVSLVCALLVMPTVIQMLKEKGIVGIDVHKPDKPEVPKGGGFVFLFAIVTGLLVIIGLTTFLEASVVNPGLLAALVSILMAGMIGLLDDMLDFSNRTKILLPMLASIPLIAMNVGTTTMSIPFVGTLDLGIVYPLIVIPLMVTFIIDSTNMYGGMNGLESGLTAVNASAVVLYVVLIPFISGIPISQMETDAGTVASALVGASLAFLIFNWYPAKVLPGDVGRLPMGAAMASALILGNMDRIAIILYAPFLLNFLLYLAYRLHVRRTGIEYVKFAEVEQDGTLKVVGPYTMYWLLPHLSGKMTEKRNVALLVLIQAIVAYGAIAFLLVAYPLGLSWF
jgi:UDP-N-acetylglucosamine--dolichyl-phosphate N-acetylglucosaminephosphotransferase